MKNVSNRRCRGDQNTHFYVPQFSENRAVYEMTWKNSVVTARQATGDNIRRGDKRTFRICNTYCFPKQQLWRERAFKVTLYVHCLSCWYQLRHVHFIFSAPKLYFHQPVSYFWFHISWIAIILISVFWFLILVHLMNILEKYEKCCLLWCCSDRSA